MAETFLRNFCVNTAFEQLCRMRVSRIVKAQARQPAKGFLYFFELVGQTARLQRLTVCTAADQRTRLAVQW